MRIYADFNALVDLGDAERPGAVHLDRLGSLRDLCALKLRLEPGLLLTLYSDSDETTDLEVDAVARWISDPMGADGGFWVGEFDPARFRDVPIVATPAPLDFFPCSACGKNLAPTIRERGLSMEDTCEACGTAIHAPLAAPARPI